MYEQEQDELIILVYVLSAYCYQFIVVLFICHDLSGGTKILFDMVVSQDK